MDPTLTSLEQMGFSRRLLEKDASLWSDDPAVQARIADRLGWLTVHGWMAARRESLDHFADEVRKRGFQRIVLLGMGGSSLAPEVFQKTFGAVPGYPRLTVLDTTDPAAILEVERSPSIERELFIVSSKSGTTIETLSLYRYFADKVRSRNGGGALDSLVAITDPETPLAAIAREEGFLRCFVNPPDIGGRYSALSYFGLVPAALIGVNTGKLLERARQLNTAAGVELGAALAEHAIAGRDKVTFIAPPGLASFGAWAEQLLAESTGKDGKGLIPVDGEPLGPPASYGDDRVFIGLDPRGQENEFSEPLNALKAAGHPVISIELQDAYDLGAEFLRWEVATAAVGAALRINPFDEPNVREGKDNTTAALREALPSGHVAEPAPAVTEDGLSLTCDEATFEALRPAGPASIGALVAAHFRRGRPGDYLAVMAYIQPCVEHDSLLTRLRTGLRDATRLATTVGYGPRFLHSTGQLHKGGPDKGVFLQLTADDRRELAIPGEPYGFSTLKQAQALGDLRSLQARGRRIIRVHLGGDPVDGLRRLVFGVETALAEAVPGGRS